MNIFISGAESTGKSWLAEQLGRHYNAQVIPEYARGYVENLKRDYNISDVELIAHEQVKEIDQDRQGQIIFFDTGLIITYVWFKDKYGYVPNWFEKLVPEKGKGKYLICRADLPWHYDPVRENPERRDELNASYMKLLDDFGFEFGVVEGVNDERFKTAVGIVDAWLKS